MDYPAWMIQHGMGAFTDPAAEGLVRGFKQKTRWTALLAD
jgi:hypothetical protein